MNRPATSNLLRFTLAALLGFLAVGFATSDADAIPPASVHTGQHGVADHGWMRTLCSVNDGGAKCAIRFTDELSEVQVTHYLGGQSLGEMISFGEPYVPNFDRHRAPLVRVTRGVHIRCEQSNAIATCDLYLARRYKDFNVSIYTANEYQGGLNGNNIEF